ncbi:MAG: hypothetical protein HY569_01200 [Candidatus Magasanikbacteria bacterium]|nr:hypothetical protein [Candidatus Magasanikbacteria bacterium]
MTEITKNFYHHCFQSPDDVKNVLVKFSQARSEMEKAGGENLERFYFYADLILKKLNTAKGEEKDRLEGVVRFLDADLVKDFINNPRDPFKEVDLSKELLTVASGLGVSAGADPYDQEDMQAMLGGTFKFYNDIPFAYTLGLIVANSKDVAVVPELLLGFLRFGNESPERGVVIKWESAFLLALIMAALWRHFGDLSDDGRKFLLNNYFYLSIVAGAPVRYALRDFVYSQGVRSSERGKLVSDCILNFNLEEVPMKTTLSEWKKFTEIVKNYIAFLGKESPGGFKHEEFLQGFYQGQPNRDVFKRWLRDVLGILSDFSA